MAYTITPTNGQNPIIVADGTLNTSTSLTLVGKNYPSYGTILDQNLFRLLENSANSTAPTAPVIGEIYWNTATNNLSVWNGSIWRILGSVTVAPANAAPATTTIGDLWWDSTNGALKGYDATNGWKLIGPMGGLANISSQTISDGNYNHTCMVFKLGVLGTTYMIFSTDAAFNPSPAIDGFQTIYPGLNLPSTAFLANAKFYGQANDSVTVGGIYANSFLRNDQNSTTTGTITIQNNNGLTIGTNNFNFNVYNNVNSVINSVTPGGMMNFQVHNGSGTNIDSMDIYPNGNVVCNYDLVVVGNIKSGGSSDFLISTTTPSINPVTGALQVRGGTGVLGNINVGGTQNYFVGNVTAANLNSNAIIRGTTINGTTLNVPTINTTTIAGATNISTTNLTVTALTASTIGCTTITASGGITGSISTAAQTNITSLGTLTSLTVSGATNLGAVSNLKISGGVAQQFLTSDGTTCSWATVTVPTDNGSFTNGAGYITAAALVGLASSSSLSAYALLAGAAFTGAISSTGSITGSSLSTSGSVSGGTGSFSGAVATGPLTVTGSISASGDITAFATSDARLKTDIKKIDGALDKLLTLTGITYGWNEVGASVLDLPDDYNPNIDREAGLIAQDVLDVLPEVTATRPNGYLAIRYERLVPLLIEAIKELKSEINELKSVK
jgi:hypothetical protein